MAVVQTNHFSDLTRRYREASALHVPSLFFRAAYRCGQGLRQVRSQILHILNPHRQPHQPIANAQLRPRRRRDAGMGHDRRVFDQAFHASQAFGQGEDVRRVPESAWRRPGRCSNPLKSSRQTRASADVPGRAGGARPGPGSEPAPPAVGVRASSPGPVHCCNGAPCAGPGFSRRAGSRRRRTARRWRRPSSAGSPGARPVRGCHRQLRCRRSRRSGH